MKCILSSITSPSQLKHLNRNQLEQLATEIRTFLLDSISKTGGHLSSNLGIVELTIALHAAFESPKDKIIFDVGHQAYVHKLLTGRMNGFESLRQFGGLSGFLKREESEHDCFEAGHSSTSISAGLGMALARDMKGEQFNVVSVIGDGALTGGMAYEALNHAGHEGTNLIVVLNDNEMSIDTNVGGMSKYLASLRTSTNYYRAKDEVEELLNRIPGVGKTFVKSVQKVKDSVKYFLVAGVLFEEIGFTYLGPVNGHDIVEVKEALRMAKNVNGPVLVHTLTKKGRGYKLAEKSPDKFHGVNPFDLETGKKKNTAGSLTFSQVFGETMMELAEHDERIVAITAAMPSGTGLSDFRQKFMNRFIDVGIAEQHAVTLAAGLASQGMRPVFAVYSTFLQRAYDQIVHDVCMQNLPVTFAIDRAGLVGQDGETHHGVFDLSYLQHMPNLTIMAPKDGHELRSMLLESVHIEGPVAIRYPRGTSYTMTLDHTVSVPLKIHQQGGGDAFLIIAIGTRYYQGVELLSALADEGVEGTVVQPRILKPFPTDDLSPYLEKYRKIIILEDNVKIGGFGARVLEHINQLELKDKEILHLGYDDQFICHGKVDRLLEALELDTEHVQKQIRKFIKED